MKYKAKITVKHWLPFLTVCPVTHLYEWIWVEADFTGFVELFKIRKRIKSNITANRERFMEEIARDVFTDLEAQGWPVCAVRVKLFCNKHIVEIIK